MQMQPRTNLFGNPPADLAVLLLEAFAKIMQQQRQVKSLLLGDVAVSFADRIFAIGDAGDMLDRLEAVFVDGELVVLVELQQAAGRSEERRVGKECRSL